MTSPAAHTRPAPVPDSRDAIYVQNLRKSYGNNSVLEGLNLRVAAGETYALLGPNGAGKSTTVEILEGFRTRTSGEVKVLGVDPAQGERSWRDRIGVVLQEAAQVGVMKVAEQLRHYASFYARPKDVDQVLESVGLTQKADAKISTLSGGQRRRLDVALSIIGSPQVLFLDEPTTGFDPQARREFWNVITGLKSEGTTILLTTHDMAEAANLADRIGVVAGGVIAHEGGAYDLGGTARHTPHVTWIENGHERCEITMEPGKFVAGLINRLGHEPPGLRITRPNLEDIYLDLVDGAAK